LLDKYSFNVSISWFCLQKGNKKYGIFLVSYYTLAIGFSIINMKLVSDDYPEMKQKEKIKIKLERYSWQ
jgi:hypothetical protein